ncbi:hypothetical protein E3E31_07080 [Thermococcus sp. M39]|uniref:hypothetical protein n=1 Tax=unclassified Thermococcus TaxID=2627626 RepID=UPI00143B0DF9|nr:MULTISPECIES: hypothetical protein [unclassified Thermococcus]NJE08285.1 hypothetical protein [Thermococcus sp. M39]NJE11778.1 hypothetical protein [Thermococcus sp. LS2]
MLAEFTVGFLFTLAWAGFFVIVGKQKSIWKATLGVTILFLVMMVLNYARYHLGEPLGWFLGAIVGFLFSLWFIQRVGSEKPTKESAVAMFLFDPLIFVVLLIVVLFL